MEGTVRTCNEASFMLRSGICVNIPQQKLIDAIRGTEKYCVASQQLLTASSIAKCHHPKVHVVCKDCLVAAIGLQREGLNPAVLNMANANTPGGGYKTGAAAQEENLFRRTALFLCLDESQSPILAAAQQSINSTLYPLAELEGIYSPEVLVLRGEEKDGYPYIDPESTATGLPAVSFLTVAAYNRPELIELHPGSVWPGTEKQTEHTGTMPLEALTPEMAVKTMRKIALILEMALRHGHNAVVLSAFGCGAFGNPPRHIAALFWAVLYNYLHQPSSKPYVECFERVVFAIIDDSNARRRSSGNFEPFKQCFNFHAGQSPTGSEPETTSGHSGSAQIWQWFTERSGTWQNYSLYASRKIEQQWQEGSSEFIMQEQGNDYKIKLGSQMVQQNLRTGKERRLRRVPLFNSVQD